MNSNRLRGTVSWFNTKKGFGVIESGGTEYFVHHTNIVNETHNHSFLNEKQEVSFIPYQNGNDNKCAASFVKNKDNQVLDFSLPPTENSSIRKKHKRRPRHRNTENFNPSHQSADIRVLVGTSHYETYQRDIFSRDVIVIPDLFLDLKDPLKIYQDLLVEIKSSGKEEDGLWKLWHGDSHLIADDHLAWKQSCPTFNRIIEKIKTFFSMDIKATRLNWYQDSDQWKPFHHDAAAVKKHIAKKQNLTVGISFGLERDISFQHAKTKTTVSFPMPNGSVYAFGKDVNIIWKHGIPQLPPELKSDQGRISIIAWGWGKQIDVSVLKT